MEAHTFGAGLIYTVLQRLVSCQNEPFCAKRLFSEGDEEKRTWWCRICDVHQAHIGTWRGWSTHALHMET